jgi:hypothetical protein
VITSPELLPDVEFVIKTSDAPQGGDDEHPLWVLDRTKSQEEVWLMPDYGFYSWPEPKVGGMVEVRDKTAEREASLTWDSKISKAFWRGAILVKLREVCCSSSSFFSPSPLESTPDCFFFLVI